jgi:hypothetical protein
MKIQTKLTALLLTLPIAYAADLSGSVTAINTLGEATMPSSFFATDGSFDGSSGIIVQIDNNNANGWEVTADSSNGSMFALQDGSGNVANYNSIDGKNLQYKVACDAVAEASETTAISLGNAASPVVISTSTIPTEATVASEAGSLICHLSAVDGETANELFAGNYKDIITLNLDNL